MGTGPQGEAAPRPRSQRCRVLEEVSLLGAELAPGARVAATRAATATVVRLEAGPQPVSEWFGSSLHGPGLLILHGIIAKEVHVEGRTATELLGPGDLLRPWDADD